MNVLSEAFQNMELISERKRKILCKENTTEKNLSKVVMINKRTEKLFKSFVLLILIHIILFFICKLLKLIYILMILSIIHPFCILIDDWVLLF